MPHAFLTVLGRSTPECFWGALFELKEALFNFSEEELGEMTSEGYRQQIFREAVSWPEERGRR